MSTFTSSDAAKAVVRRNTEEVQGKGRFDIFEELFADDFVDHTPQPNMPTRPNCGSMKMVYGTTRSRVLALPYSSRLVRNMRKSS